jgi:hypothetical protein
MLQEFPSIFNGRKFLPETPRNMDATWNAVPRARKQLQIWDDSRACRCGFCVACAFAGTLSPPSRRKT